MLGGVQPTLKPDVVAAELALFGFGFGGEVEKRFVDIVASRHVHVVSRHVHQSELTEASSNGRGRALFYLRLVTREVLQINGGYFDGHDAVVETSGLDATSRRFGSL